MVMGNAKKKGPGGGGGLIKKNVHRAIGKGVNEWHESQ